MRLYLALLFGICGPLCFGQTNVLTYHNDNSRTGQNLNEVFLTPASVTASTFGKLFIVPADGKVDAQPLYVSGVSIPGVGVRNVVYAATEHDSVYAFDADTGTVYWTASMLGTGETTSDPRSCGQITPEIGITGTPVIDLSAGPHGTIYLVAMSRNATNYYQRLHALDITTGMEEFGGPTTVQATYPGSGDNSSGGSVIFDAKQYKSRPGLLLVGGTVYSGWGSHCDVRPYTGWLMGYNGSTLQQTSVFNFAPNGNEAGLWNAGGGLAADTAGNIFVDVANGTFDTNLTAQGFPNKGDYGNAFVRLSTASGQLQAVDYWTMDNTVSESAGDVDLGSGGLVLLPDLVDGSGRTRHLGTGAGKDSAVYVFDRDNMGKFDANNNGTLYQELPGGLANGEYASPAWFNGTVYYGAINATMRAFKVSDATLSSVPSSTTVTIFDYPGPTPSISANGTSNPILWAVQNSSPAVLHAYDANNLATEFYNSNQSLGRDQFGNGNKFITPTVVNGKVFVGTPNGVAVFGLLGHPQAVLGAISLPFGNQQVGQASAPARVTLSNPGNGLLVITGISVSGANSSDFTQTNDCGSTVAAAGSCTISVVFQPSATGSRTATLTISDNAANSPQAVALTGSGVTNATTYTISGQITSGGGYLSGVLMTLNGSATTTTNASGNYSFAALQSGGNYTVSPSLAGYQFSPPSKTFTNLTSNQTANFTATGGALTFVPVNACRVADTRNPNGPFGGPSMAAGSSRGFQIPGSACGIPASAAAYALNVTAVPHSHLGYLTIWPSGGPQPFVSTLNSDGRIKANAAIVPAGASGGVSVFVTDTTDVILDISGYFVPSGTPSSLSFYHVAPCRAVDTRGPAGPLGGPYITGQTMRSFQLTGTCGIPSGASAYAANFTVVPHQSLRFITAWPTGHPQPLASTLNAVSGTITANAELVQAGNNGSVSVFASDNTDVVIDIQGYFATPAAGGLSLYPVTPCRVIDTRTGPGAQPFTGFLTVGVAGTCNVPASAQAYGLNATAVPQSSLQWLGFWPNTSSVPLVSTLNALDGAITSNMAIVSAGTGSINPYAANPTYLILDIASYFAP